MKLHILFAKDEPIAVSRHPFTLPDYGDKTSLTQRVYAPVQTVEGVEQDLGSEA